jgi:superfamily I DNA/RNA helicase
MGERIAAALEAAGIPVDWLGRSRAHRKYKPGEESVKLLTMHSSKGLEFPVVMIPWLNAMPSAREEPAAEAKLLYVAMTRAMEHLVVTHHAGSPFVQRLGEAMRRAA